MKDFIFVILSFVLTAIAFIYGATKLYSAEKPLYYRIMIAAIGCYLLQELSSLGFYLCGGFDIKFTTSNIGIFCCSCLIISAEVCLWKEEGKKDCGFVPYVAPIILMILMIWCLIIVRQNDGIIISILTCITELPMLIASFHCTRHLILARSKDNNFATTKWCAIFSLVYFALTIMYFPIEYYCSSLVTDIFYVVITLNIVLLTVNVVKGEKKWKI